MTDKIIKFLAGNPSETDLHNEPVPIVKTLPIWYKDFPKFEKYDDKKYPTVKSCVPFFDAMTAGYTILTPCDIEFYMNNNEIACRVLDNNFETFIASRPPMNHFPEIPGYYETHFHWLPHWAVLLPEGYSALYVHPLNRFELPFMSTNGIIDNDGMTVAGQIPFFLKKGFTGIIKKGTPIIQIFPFKREDWDSEIVKFTPKEYNERIQEGMEKYRNVDHGGYKSVDWHQKRYG